MKTDLENKWIAALILDDESAFLSIYNKYSERVYKFSFLFLKDTGWSEDIVQEVFVRLWNSRSQLNPNGSLWAYIYVLTKRAALNKLREIQKTGTSLDKLWTNISQLSDCSHQKLIAKEFLDHLEDVLSDLPDRQREVFKLSRFEGFTHQEIAEVLNISPNTVKNHMIQALKVVRSRTLGMDYVLLLFLIGVLS